MNWIYDFMSNVWYLSYPWGSSGILGDLPILYDGDS